LFIQTNSTEYKANALGELSAVEPEQLEIENLFESPENASSLMDNLSEIISPCTTNQLATIFGVHRATIVRKMLNKNFTEWTIKYDPDGIGWTYSEETKLFYRQAE
jgi:hypothetical protein